MKRIPFLFAMSTAVAFAAMVAAFGNVNAEVSETGLLVNFSESGLQPGSSANIKVTGHASAVWACTNPGGHVPAAGNKRTTVSYNGQISAGMTADNNGQLNGAITLRTPTATNFGCPAGQTKELASVTFTNARIQDTVSGVSQSIAGTFSRTFIRLR